MGWFKVFSLDFFMTTVQSCWTVEEQGRVFSPSGSRICD